MDHTAGTRLFQATVTYLRSQPMLTEKEVQDLLMLKEYVDRIHRFYRRRGSTTGSSKASFITGSLRPMRRRSVGSSVSSMNGLMPTRAGTEGGLTTATIKGILAAVDPYIELTEYDINTSVFEKIFGSTVAYYWSLYKPGAGRIAVLAVAWLVFYSTPLETMVLPAMSLLITRLIATGCIGWLVLYFWSQLNWRMTLEALSYFDAWFFVTHAVLYAGAYAALCAFDHVTIAFNVMGVLGFSAIIAYDAYPLYSRRTARYVLVIILLIMIGIMLQMGRRSNFLNRDLYLDISHGLVNTTCAVRVNDTVVPCEAYLTWGFNVYDFAFQRLQILAIYMTRNTYWAFRAPRYCVIIKSRVALEEVPVHAISVSQVSTGMDVYRRNSLVRTSLAQMSSGPETSTMLSPTDAILPPMNEASEARLSTRRMSASSSIKVAPMMGLIKNKTFRLSVPKQLERTSSNRLMSSNRFLGSSRHMGSVLQRIIPEGDWTDDDRHDRHDSTTTKLQPVAPIPQVNVPPNLPESPPPVATLSTKSLPPARSGPHSFRGMPPELADL
ncbi:hypothetical protein SDRG_01679 [Saprolegnia diclina VS20]|uniref:Transmembrane protein n=1 Tax=Saprolegnia diclina (strain VS20) TaxID=1156394 RepID=T0S8U8_SAPDV|nr:hypothetical protein SDRG_01679 [Saprolegnia diclina VS20]EQC41723.1 hypothetical protein SDRG_01679 [Saprolegnia diclina VS20]|eukprot:XP_008605437.1 hypothetical protein SDRG_01679 [Saprolegnia diclina VS20]